MAGTNIDDIMLAAGLTRGAFYAHFASRTICSRKPIRTGHGLLGRLRGGEPAAVLKAYLDKADSRRHRAGLHPRRPARRRRPR